MFFHARFTVFVLIALGLVGLVVAAVRVPRNMELRCVPSTPPRLDCVSTVRAPFRRADSTRVSLTESDIEVKRRLLSPEPPQPSLADLEVYLAQRGFGDRTCWYIVAKWGSARENVHEDCSPVHATEPRVAPFAQALQRGEPATLGYRSGWGGLGLAFSLLGAALFSLWLGSGRTRVTFDPESGNVDVESRNFWLAKPEHRRFARSEIVEVLVLRSTPEGGSAMYRPAFRPATGEVVPLGATGLGSPRRARHWVGLLTRMLAEESDAPSRSS